MPQIRSTAKSTPFNHMFLLAVKNKVGGTNSIITIFVTAQRKISQLRLVL